MCISVFNWSASAWLTQLLMAFQHMLDIFFQILIIEMLFLMCVMLRKKSS